MKKISFVILLALFLFGGKSIAQDMDIEWGKAFDSKTEVQKILGFSDDIMVSYSIKGKKRFFDFYKKENYSYIKSTEYELPKLENKKSGMLNVFLSGDKIEILLYVYYKKTKSFTLYVQEMDMKGKLLGRPKNIYKSKESGDKIKDLKVDVKFSSNFSKAMVYFDRKNKEKTTFFSDRIIFDIENEFKEISNSTKEYKIRDSKSDKVKYSTVHSIDNDGKFNMISEVKEFTKGKISDFKLIVYRYDEKANLIGDAELKDGDKLFGSSVLVAKDNKVYVVGYYANNPKNRAYLRGYSGLYTAELSSDMELKGITTTHFSDEFLKNIYSAKKVAKKSEKGKELVVPVAYKMKDVIVHGDGNLTVLSEYHTVIVTYQKNTKITTTTYGPILFFKLNKEGEILASDAIKKMQTSSSSSVSIGVGLGALTIFTSVEFPDKLSKYWSYALSLDSKGTVYLVFNDHFKNAADGEDDLSKPMRNPKKSVPYLVKIEKDGNFSKNSMVGSGDTETYTVPQVIYPVSDSEFVIWGVWKKQNKFGLTTIK